MKVNIDLDEVYEVTLFSKGKMQEAKVSVNLAKLTAESVLEHMRHGIKQRLTDAASTTKGLRADKVKAARAVASAIEANTVRARAAGLSPRMKLVCDIYIARFAGGKPPKGGSAVTLALIEKLPAAEQAAIHKIADAVLSIDI